MRERLLNMPASEKLPQDTRVRGRLLNILLVGVALIAITILVALISARVIGFTQFESILYKSAFVLLIGISFIYWLNKQGKVYLAGVLFLLLITSAITLSDNTYELVVGRSLIFFIIPIMMASFLLRSYASFIVASLLVIQHAILWRSPELSDVDFSPFGMFAFFAFALITWLAARSLENALVQAHEINLHLDELVGERTRELAEANAYLESANERLQELDALKSKFVSDVSHELRTPISNISIYLEMLEDTLSSLGKTLPEKVTNFINVASQETKRLSKLINDILNSSRIEQSLATPEMQPVDVHGLIQGIIEINRLNAEAKGLKLDVTTAPTTPSLLADAEQLKQVFTNLVANAINYTVEGTISISTTTRNELFTFVIQDTGMGIASDDIPHLFERFYRGQQASRSSIPGTGLGLAITKEIIELHQGNIEVQSEINIGTTLIVTFPIHKTESEQ